MYSYIIIIDAPSCCGFTTKSNIILLHVAEIAEEIGLHVAFLAGNVTWKVFGGRQAEATSTFDKNSMRKS
jgi:hypothetical protein